jgi:MraZ protein
VAQDQFIGYALNTLDGKNRLSVPASYREVVQARSGEKSILVGPHQYEPCLIAYDRTHTVRIQAEIERRFGDDFGPERERFARRAFGTVEQFAFDENGRIIVSATLKELAELEGQAFFLGVGENFEIWNPARLLEARADDRMLCRIVETQLRRK